MLRDGELNSPCLHGFTTDLFAFLAMPIPLLLYPFSAPRGITCRRRFRISIFPQYFFFSQRFAWIRAIPRINLILRRISRLNKIYDETSHLVSHYEWVKFVRCARSHSAGYFNPSSATGARCRATERCNRVENDLTEEM